MTTALGLLMLFGGCVYLLVGGDFLVRGALAVSSRTRLNPVIVGLTVVAIGTSAPELIVSLHSALTGHPGIAIGNVVGSNIANALLVLGAPALVYPIAASGRLLKHHALFMVAVTVCFVVMCFSGTIDRLDGIILLTVLAGGVVLTLKGSVSMPGIDIEDAENQLDQTLGLPRKWHSITALVVLGCIFLPVGAELAVEGAVHVAQRLGVSEAAIGSTIVALGTSLPELSSTLVAAYRKSLDLALGNVVGSNVLNLLAILGLTAVVVDIPVPALYPTRDVWVLLASTLLLSAYIWSRQSIGRKSGAMFCMFYLGYLVLSL